MGRRIVRVPIVTLEVLIGTLTTPRHLIATAPGGCDASKVPFGTLNAPKGTFRA